MSEVSVFWLKDEEATVSAGEALASGVRSVADGRGLVIFLHGSLGAGKTTLSRGMIRGLGHKGAVKSPTYTLVEPYEFLQPPTWHFDLYRLADPEELEFMGIRDYLAPGNVCLVEWPERGQGVLPVADLELTLAAWEGGRELIAEYHSKAGQALLDCLIDHLVASVPRYGAAPGEYQE